jgi:diacylglycerol O-acyltransferase
MKYLSPVDAAFLRMESIRTPMHVGGLMTFRLPDDAPAGFLRELLAHMRQHPFMPAPFGSKLSKSWLSGLAPSWEPAKLDTDYHIRHSALPYPGGERELGILVERLHSHPLDLSRPLWEAHLIEGLENRRFAFYFKAHHCAIDGMGAMKMVRNWLSEDPSDRSGPVIGDLPKSAMNIDKAQKALFRNALKKLGGNARATAELLKKLREMGQGEHNTIRAARETPRTLFNVPISQQRRLGTQLLELARVKAVATAAGVTVNDITLAITSGAVRRYLLEYNALPVKSLTASVPVALPRTDGKGGNAVAGFVCPLATQEADPLRRIEVIKAMTGRAKKELLGMSPAALEQFTLMGLSPLILGQMAGVLPKLPPFFNFVVSNVVGSKVPLYLRGAELEAMYPMSILFDGYAINVTIIGLADRIAIGFTGCRDAIPRLQRLAIYTSDALVELERAVGIAPPATKSAKKASAVKKSRKK